MCGTFRGMAKTTTVYLSTEQVEAMERLDVRLADVIRAGFQVLELIGPQGPLRASVQAAVDSVRTVPDSDPWEATAATSNDARVLSFDTEPMPEVVRSARYNADGTITVDRRDKGYSIGIKNGIREKRDGQNLVTGGTVEEVSYVDRPCPHPAGRVLKGFCGACGSPVTKGKK
jgi:hypothetical protein